jgi:hypothetical protein
MKKYAVLNSESQVVNIIIASSLDIAESVTSSLCILVAEEVSVDIGYTYSEGLFVNPNTPDGNAAPTGRVQE